MSKLRSLSLPIIMVVNQFFQARPVTAARSMPRRFRGPGNSACLSPWICGGKRLRIHLACRPNPIRRYSLPDTSSWKPDRRALFQGSLAPILVPCSPSSFVDTSVPWCIVPVSTQRLDYGPPSPPQCYGKAGFYFLP